MLIDTAIRAEIEELTALAPLHNGPALAVIDDVTRMLPGVPQVAAFDTAFHATLPPHAYLYALPYAWYERWGVRRFGFHGLSHAYCAGRAAELLGSPLARPQAGHLPPRQRLLTGRGRRGQIDRDNDGVYTPSTAW